jgi:hypothetical protein
VRFAEAQFYFRLPDATDTAFALVSFFSKPDEEIIRRTHGVLTVCEYLGTEWLDVIKVGSIQAVVGMVPFCKQVEGRGPRFFLAEKLGLDVYDPAENDESDDDM